MGKTQCERILSYIEERQYNSARCIEGVRVYEVGKPYKRFEETGHSCQKDNGNLKEPIW